MTAFTLDGYEFACVREGAGEPLVLVHGSASDLRTWRTQVSVLAKDREVTAYSRRYHWPNAPIPPGADYSMVEQVDDLEALIEELDRGPAHLAGHSYGAFLALLLAIRRPDLVRSLVLAEPPALTLFVDPEPRPGQLLGLAVTRPRTLAAILRFYLGGLRPAQAAARRGDLETAMRRFGRAVLGRRVRGSLSAARYEQAAANTIAAEFLGSGLAPLPAREVRGVRAPVLLVGGAESPALFGRILDRLQELLPQVRRVTIRGASHIVHEDNPAAFGAAVRSFLEDCDLAVG